MCANGVTVRSKDYCSVFNVILIFVNYKPVSLSLAAHFYSQIHHSSFLRLYLCVTNSIELGVYLGFDPSCFSWYLLLSIGFFVGWINDEHGCLITSRFVCGAPVRVQSAMISSKPVFFNRFLIFDLVPICTHLATHRQWERVLEGGDNESKF